LTITDAQRCLEARQRGPQRLVEQPLRGGGVGLDWIAGNDSVVVTRTPLGTSVKVHSWTPPIPD
jgi:hypothetical protein